MLRYNKNPKINRSLTLLDHSVIPDAFKPADVFMQLWLSSSFLRQKQPYEDQNDAISNDYCKAKTLCPVHYLYY